MKPFALTLYITFSFSLGAQAKALACDDIRLRMSFRYQLTPSICDIKRVAYDSGGSFETIDISKYRRLTSRLRVIDKQVIQRFASWMEPGQSADNIELIVRGDLQYNGFFAPSTPKSIYLKEDLFFREEAFFVIFHELQHLYFYKYKGENYHPKGWLNEALSEAVEMLMTGHLAWNAIDQIRSKGQTASLLDAGFLEQDHYGESYTHGGLFILYLASHFGGEDFIRDLIKSPLAGIEAVEEVVLARRGKVAKEFLNFNSLFLNFSFMLGLNSDDKSPYGLFSVGDFETVPGLSRVQIDGELMVLKVEYDHLAITYNVPAFSAKYLFVPKEYNCMKIESSEGVKLYSVRKYPQLKVSELKKAWTSSRETSSWIYLVNLGKGHGQVKFKTCP